MSLFKYFPKKPDLFDPRLHKPDWKMPSSPKGKPLDPGPRTLAPRGPLHLARDFAGNLVDDYGARLRERVAQSPWVSLLRRR